jgi:hypothetical protein
MSQYRFRNGPGDRAVNAQGSPTDECSQALAAMHGLARQIASGQGDPMWLAHGIFGAAIEAGGFADPGEQPYCPDLSEAGAEFEQLADALELHQDKPEARAEYIALIREAAEAYLEGRPFPQWEDRGEALPWRPGS